MTARFRITHRSEYLYATPTTASYNEARITPLTTDRQLTLESVVSVTPTPPVRLLRYWDYWGTAVHAFDIHTPHDVLRVAATSTVETGPAVDPAAAEWSAIRTDALADRFSEFLAPTTWVAADPVIADAAATLANQPTPRDAVEAAVAWVGDALEYQPGTTSVQTTASDALRGGRGVCQDFAHLTLALLRSMGIPARYASGYFHPLRDTPVGETVVGESHAWIEAWTGDWWGVDPTNGVLAGERHVIVGRGRDYSDVPPLKGVYTGGTCTSVVVSVELTRVA